MRSVYAKILLWCFGTLLLSLAAFVAVSLFLSGRSMQAGGPFSRITRYLLEECVQSWETGGAPALSATLRRQQERFPMQLYVIDARGVDLVTGEDRSTLVSQAAAQWSGRRRIDVVSDPQSRYRLVALIAPPPVEFQNVWPYYLLILLALAGLCWLLAVNIASPLRKLARTVERFGAGDLDARVEWKRRDEIGELARAFNQMAGRLQTLLTAERRLLQDISHELRSPLARLNFSAELVRTAQDRDAAVARIRKDIDRLATLVSSLIEVTRVEGDPFASSLEDINLESLVREIVVDCCIEADVRGCRIQVHCPSAPTMRGDAELIHRAIENVLRNAIAHAPEGSQVEIGMESRRSTTLISIRDYGPGVPQDQLADIFKPFFRVEAARESATGGVGLGLAIAFRAITLHNGRVWAENMSSGLRVLIELPSAQLPNHAG